MNYAGPISCPNCESPISSEAAVCPYCHSTAPRSAPWKTRPTAGWAVVVLVVLVALLCCDRFLGTDLVRQLWELGKGD